MKALFKKKTQLSVLRRTACSLRSLSFYVLATGSLAIPAMAQTPSMDAAAQAIRNDKRLPTIAALAEYSVQKGPDCKFNPDANNAWMQCTIRLSESDGGDMSGAVSINFYEHPVNFGNAEASTANRVAPKEGQKFFSMAPTISGATSDGQPSGQPVAPGNCHQSRGSPNGPALCMFLMDEHILILGTANPRLSQANLENDPDAANDMVRAQKAAFIGISLAMPMASATTPPVRNIRNTVPTSASNQTSAKGRALLFNASMSSSTPISGNVTWQPQINSTISVLSGSVDFTGSHLKVAVDFSRNNDKGVPTNKIVSIKFDAPDQPIREVPVILVRRGNQPHGGDILHGVAAHIIDNVAMFAASADPKEAADNLALLRTADWIDFPVVYANGQKGVVSVAVDDSCRSTLLKIFSN